MVKSHESFNKAGLSLCAHGTFILGILLFVHALPQDAHSQIDPAPTPQTHLQVQTSLVQAITHVTLIDPKSGAEERSDRTILFRGSTILNVEKSGEAHIPPGTKIHDERGQYVMPGLWDVHVHLLQVGPKAFPLFLANGITSVRDMGSDLIEIHQWQVARSQGGLIPRILTPGPKLDGMSYDQMTKAFMLHTGRIDS